MEVKGRKQTENLNFDLVLTSCICAKALSIPKWGEISSTFLRTSQTHQENRQSSVEKYLRRDYHYPSASRHSLQGSSNLASSKNLSINFHFFIHSENIHQADSRDMN